MLFRFIVSAESGNLLIWNRILEQVIYKEERGNIRQVILTNYLLDISCLKLADFEHWQNNIMNVFKLILWFNFVP
jgi:hypothetical protein